MEEARRVLQRLERIERLDREGASSDALLSELRALVLEAEAWVRAEPEPERLRGTVERCRAALEGAGREEGMLLAR